MKKINYKKILLIIIIAVIILSISTVSFASLVDITTSAASAVPGAVKLMSIGSIILGIVQIIAVVVALVMLVVLAIKYMTAAPGEKADVKKSLLIYAVGALILFSGAGLLNIIQAMGNQINSGANINDDTLLNNKPTTSVIELA